LNYGHPKDSIGEMKKFLEKLTKKCKENKVPVIGGNVSLYNATDDVSINPTPILVMVGVSS
jgi:phosphoribosylformylglycinamidine synthase